MKAKDINFDDIEEIEHNAHEVVSLTVAELGILLRREYPFDISKHTPNQLRDSTHRVYESRYCNQQIHNAVSPIALLEDIENRMAGKPCRGMFSKRLGVYVDQVHDARIDNLKAFMEFQQHHDVYVGKILAGEGGDILGADDAVIYGLNYEICQELVRQQTEIRNNGSSDEKDTAKVVDAYMAFLLNNFNHLQIVVCFYLAINKHKVAIYPRSNKSFMDFSEKYRFAIMND